MLKTFQIGNNMIEIVIAGNYFIKDDRKRFKCPHCNYVNYVYEVLSPRCISCNLFLPRFDLILKHLYDRLRWAVKDN